MNIIKDEGVFRLYDHQATLILTDEKQLRRIAEHPEMPLFDDVSETMVLSQELLDKYKISIDESKIEKIIAEMPEAHTMTMEEKLQYIKKILDFCM